MSVRILDDTTEGIAALYCSTSMWVFGPVFHDDGHTDPAAAAQCFLDWWDGQGFMDPRTVEDALLESRQKTWLDAVAGGKWTGAAEECALCHGDPDFSPDEPDIDRQPFDMSGATPGAER